MQNCGRCDFRDWVSVSVTPLLSKRHTVSIKATDLTTTTTTKAKSKQNNNNKKTNKKTHTTDLDFFPLLISSQFSSCFSCHLHNSAQRVTSLRK